MGARRACSRGTGRRLRAGRPCGGRRGLAATPTSPSSGPSRRYSHERHSASKRTHASGWRHHSAHQVVPDPDERPPVQTAADTRTGTPRASRTPPPGRPPDSARARSADSLRVLEVFRSRFTRSAHRASIGLSLTGSCAAIDARTRSASGPSIHGIGRGEGRAGAGREHDDPALRERPRSATSRIRCGGPSGCRAALPVRSGCLAASSASKSPISRESSSRNSTSVTPPP